MPHDHHHHHHHVDPNAGDAKVLFAVAVNVLLTVAQIGGGAIAGSVALVADGVHNFSDAAALVLAFGARRLARRGADAAMSFGWARAEIVAAFVNYIALILISIWLVVEALGRMIDPPQVDGWIVVWLAGLALIVDLGTAALTYALSKHSLNIRAAFLHNLADAGASVAVIVGGAVILLYDWRLIDPLLTIGISAFILWHVWGDMKPVLRILMLGAPPEADSTEVRAALSEIAGVKGVHHVHLWQIDERRVSVEAHLVLAADAPYAPVIARAKAMLAARFDIHHATLEPETAQLGCADPPAHAD
ncbi:cation diffusion facilitator family transporter [Thioclava dalianensis]|uniref:Cation diffusion facilitator family transporter n=1 Tax=Thioclava dalianensis TaxID=1185766 RepID=A0A074THV4_9RHOB|nr:cation diffusion facilitator family transporter [Thioclava dalianensis]KEP68623.1 cation diffusion facilitator family transporter [Thioclava dalianensis]SFN04507.1 cobalt-zinc-cadmium efflux system protein [Thioclava dalianensis]